MTATYAAPGGGSASIDAEPTATTSSLGGPPLGSRIHRLQDLDSAALRKEWRGLCRSEPPRVSRDLLVRALAYRLQELEFGGLPKWARQSLAAPTMDSIPSDAGEPTQWPAALRLKPGARLVREWHGRAHAVAVLDDAFEFEGRRYRSLTQVAREITDAHWSGRRFFGLANRRVRPRLEAVQPPPAKGVSDPTQPKRGELWIEIRSKTTDVGRDARCCGRRAEGSADG